MVIRLQLSIETNHSGSFTCSFVIPFSSTYAGGVTRKVEATDSSFNKAEAQLMVLAGIALDPSTSPTSPGYVGMELTVRGVGFIAKATVTITYSEDSGGYHGSYRHR